MPETRTPSRAPFGGLPSGFEDAAPPHDAAPAASFASRPVGAPESPLDPPPPSVLDAARWHPRLVVGALVVALAIALALGITRPAVYSATAQLRVGGFDASVPGAVSGFATASVALATSYSYSVDDPAVVGAVARELHVPRERVLGAVTASALPERPVFRVRARAASEPRAVAFANAAARALAQQRIGVTSPRLRTLRLRAYQRAAERLAGLRAQQRTRQAAYQASESAADGRALARAEAAVAAQQIALDARRDAYAAGAQSATSAPVVELVAPARHAVSDKRATLQLYLIVALAAGLSAGLALAVLAERRTRRRHWA